MITSLKTVSVVHRQQQFSLYYYMYHGIENTSNQNTGKPLYIRRYHIQPTHHAPRLCCFDCVDRCIFRGFLTLSLGITLKYHVYFLGVHTRLQACVYSEKMLVTFGIFHVSIYHTSEQYFAHADWLARR